MRKHTKTLYIIANPKALNISYIVVILRITNAKFCSEVNFTARKLSKKGRKAHNSLEIEYIYSTIITIDKWTNYLSVNFYLALPSASKI